MIGGMDWQQIATDISASLGEAFEIDRQTSVGGGCVNSAFRVEGRGRQFFVKLNSAELLEMFIAESAGLVELARPGVIRVPAPVCHGISGGQAFLVLDYLPFAGGGQDAMPVLGRQLAELHRYTARQFGWSRNNTIGATPQLNDWQDDWPSFWREQRLAYQLQLAERQGARRQMLKKAEALMVRVADFFSDYQPVASLLHGDLWSGNYACLASAEPVIFDPAVYYGDRETDIAMTELFGGFSADFYAAYNQAWPLDSGYSQRKIFYNLYHILNHFNMFGGGYAAQAESMIDRLLSEVT